MISEALRTTAVPEADEPRAGLESLAITARYRRGQEISSGIDPSDSWYRVISGAVRLCALHFDGRRQIVDLLLPNDFFGFSSEDDHLFLAEAIVEDTVVAAYPRRRVELLAESDLEIAHMIREMALETIARLQRQLFILGRVTAPEKVGAFILEMAARLSDGSSDRVILPLSRYDIADYLAMSVETVSRALTELKQRGMISLPGVRQVQIIDRDALEEGRQSEHPQHSGPRLGWRDPDAANARVGGARWPIRTSPRGDWSRRVP